MRKLSVTLLAQAVTALAATPPAVDYVFSTEKEMKELLDLGYVIKNDTIKDDKGNIAFKATDAGKLAAGGSGAAGAPAEPAKPKPTFTIVTDAPLDKIARAGGGGNRESMYPTGDLGNGHSFFVPATADMKSPSKTLGSIVGAANKRFNKPDDFRRFTSRSVVGDKWGQPGVKGVAIYRVSAEDEAAAKAKAFPATPASA